jgi:peptide/nickel transport system permease protein
MTQHAATYVRLHRVRTAGERRHTPATLVAGLILLTILVVIAVFAPLLAPYNPEAQNATALLQGISAHHWLGTDELGRDVFSRLLYATRADLEISVAAVAASWLIGTSLGLLAGYAGGIIDAIIMRLVDFVMAFPFYVLIIALVFVIGSGFGSILLALIVVGWVSYARIVRGEVRVVATREYIAAARMTGIRGRWLLLRHVLPNVVVQPVVYAMSDVINVILAIVTLGFLGLGVQPPTPEWGLMISDGSDFLATHWGLATFPTIAVVITGLAFSLIGDGFAELVAEG